MGIIYHIDEVTGTVEQRNAGDLALTGVEIRNRLRLPPRPDIERVVIELCKNVATRRLTINSNSQLPRIDFITDLEQLKSLDITSTRVGDLSPLLARDWRWIHIAFVTGSQMRLATLNGLRTETFWVEFQTDSQCKTMPDYQANRLDVAQWRLAETDRLLNGRPGWVRVLAGSFESFRADYLIEELRLSDCRRLRQFEPSQVGKLALNGCRNLDLSSLAHLAGLRVLEMRGSKLAEQLEAIPSLPDLEHLVLWFAPRSRPDVLRGLDRHPRLRGVWCGGLPEQARILGANWPGIQFGTPIEFSKLMHKSVPSDGDRAFKSDSTEG